MSYPQNAPSYLKLTCTDWSKCKDTERFKITITTPYHWNGQKLIEIRPYSFERIPQGNVFIFNSELK